MVLIRFKHKRILMAELLWIACCIENIEKQYPDIKIDSRFEVLCCLIKAKAERSFHYLNRLVDGLFFCAS